MNQQTIDFEHVEVDSITPFPVIVLLEKEEDRFFYFHSMSEPTIELLGLTVDQAKAISKEGWYDFLHPDDYAAVGRYALELFEGDRSKQKRFFMARIKKQGDEDYSWFAGYMKRGAPIDGHRCIHAFFFMPEDIEFLDRQMWSRGLSNRLVTRDVLDAADEPIFWKDATGRYLGANQSFYSFFGIEPGEIVGKKARNFDFFPDHESCAKAEESMIKGERPAIQTTINVIAKGETRTVRLNYRPLLRDDKVIGLVGSFYDITESLNAQRDLWRLANYDSLTGVMNRRMFFSLLREAERDFREQGQPFSILMMDLDAFKDVNDTYGHDVGDLVLIAFSERLNDLLEGKGKLARIGGDEFVALIPHDDEAALLELKESIEKAMKAPLAIKNRKILIGVSVGFQICRNFRDIDAMMREADRYMYESKRIRKKSREQK